MPLRRRRNSGPNRFRFRRCRILPFPPANLYGKPLTVSYARRGGDPYLSINEPFEPTGSETMPLETARLDALRRRLRAELSHLQATGTLTKTQVRRILLLLCHVHMGVRALADVEGVSAAAVHCCIKDVIERWPAFGRAWALKKTLIVRRKVQCSTDSSSEF